METHCQSFSSCMSLYQDFPSLTQMRNSVSFRKGHSVDWAVSFHATLYCIVFEHLYSTSHSIKPYRSPFYCNYK